MPVATTGSKELDALQARFKRGYTLEKRGSGHFRVRNPRGELVEHNGKNITLTGTAAGGRALANMTAQLNAAGVLRASENGKAGRPKGIQRSEEEIEQRRRAQEVRDKNRQKDADALYERIAAVVPGGVEARGTGADLALIGAMIARERRLSDITPDLLFHNANRVLNKHWVSFKYQEVWDALLERLEGAEDKADVWFALVREARGLPEEYVHVGKPVKGDWPFEVELLPIEVFLLDHTYQRPPDWPFIRRNAAKFDESLIGTIDVAARGRGAVYAILDGQQRYEMCRLVGKKTIWASVYSGLDIASEARFFLHKNRDKKAIHPYYTFRARLAAQEPEAMEIEKITKRFGYRVTAQAATERNPEQISAIAALDEAYNRTTEDGYESLTPTLEVMKESTFGLRHGQNHILIRALGILFSETNHDVDFQRVKDVLVKTPPELMLQKAREAARYANSNTAWAMARVIAADYDRGLTRGDKIGKL
jgi:hypothetical protein